MVRQHGPVEGGAGVRVVGYVPDLMDRSRVTAAVPDVRFVASASDLARLSAETGADVIVLDLGRPGALDVVPELLATGTRVIGFASHVDRATFDRAAEAGCEVLARSVFFSRLRRLP